MKFSEITIPDVAEYLRLETDDYTEPMMSAILSASKSYVLDYTNLTEVEADEIGNLYLAVMVLCQDMYDNRSMYVDKSNVNNVVSSILDMHRKNLVG